MINGEPHWSSYEKEFKFFINLYENKKLPNKIFLKARRNSINLFAPVI